MAAPDDRAVAIRLGGATALLLLLVGQAQVTVLDGSSMLAVAQSIVHDGDLTVPRGLGVAGDGGESYSKYGLLLPLLSLLPVALVQPVGAVTGRTDLLEGAAAASLMPLIVAGLAVALFALGRRLGAPRRAALLVAAGTVLGTFVLPYGRDFFTEPLVALGLVAMVERVLAGREGQAAAWLAFAILARPQSAAFAPLLLGWLWLRGAGLGGILRTLPWLAGAGTICVAYNLVRFSDATEFGYREPADPGFTTPFLEGAAGLLLSPEKSVFLFAPAIVLVPLALARQWRREPWTAAVMGALFAAVFALAATWWSWEGGWSWGPRLILPGVVLLLAALGPWIGEDPRRFRAAAGLFAAGLAISLPAVVAPAGAQLLEGREGDGPQIVRQYTDIPDLASNSADTISDRSRTDDDYRRYLALWQANAVRKVGRGGLVAAGVGTLLLLAALWRVSPPLLRELRAGWGAG